MENKQPGRSNDFAFWLLLIALIYLAWPTLSQGHVVAQPATMPQPIIINQTSAAPALPALALDCIAALHSVPPGWEEGFGGPTPPCWNQWSKAQRIEFLNYVQKKAQSKP
jgi:hypothetical protein